MYFCENTTKYNFKATQLDDKGHAIALTGDLESCKKAFCAFVLLCEESQQLEFNLLEIIRCCDGELISRAEYMSRGQEICQ